MLDNVRRPSYHPRLGVTYEHFVSTAWRLYLRAVRWTHFGADGAGSCQWARVRRISDWHARLCRRARGGVLILDPSSQDGRRQPGARSSTDRASDYGSEGWGFESLRARSSRSAGRSRLTWAFVFPAPTGSGSVTSAIGTLLTALLTVSSRVGALVRALVRRVVRYLAARPEGLGGPRPGRTARPRHRPCGRASRLRV